MRNNSLRKGKGKKVYSLIVDGETEIWYFQLMKKHENLPRIDIIPELPKKKKLEDQFNLVLEKSKDYSEVFWVVDVDTIFKEEREMKKGDISPLKQFEEYLTKIEGIGNVHIIINIPCFEFWFLLHFKQTNKYFDNYESLLKDLKKNDILYNYEKTEKFFKRRNNDIYQILLPFKANAIINGRNLGDFDITDPKSGKGEIYKIFDLLK